MKKIVKLLCVVLCLATLALCFAGCSSSSSSKSKKSGSGGFVGSDGEYHNYIPEFGDDVNNWMAENW